MNLQEQLKIIREKRPLIESITNPVTVNDCANILLAVGASPIMAHHINEVKEVQKSCNGLLLNLGATDDYESMLIAAKTANESGHPIVLDPVGVAISGYRRDFLVSMMEKTHIDCIRCNYGEAISIIDNKGANEGLDSKVSLENESDKAKFIEKVSDFSEKKGIFMLVSGPVDYIIYGNRVEEVSLGSAMMKNVTGMGCMYSEVAAAFLAVDKSADSLKNAAILYGECGKEAEEMMGKGGTMSFRNAFIDCMSIKGCLG